MKRSTQISLLAALAVMLFAYLLVANPAAAQHRAATAIEGARFDTGNTIKDNLKIYIGKDVVIHLRSGKSIQGYVKTVGDHLVHIEKLASGRDFYDALIRIEDITAIEAKFREMK